MRNLPHALYTYLVNVQTMSKIFSNFVCFPESPNFTALGGKFKFSAQKSYLAPSIGNGTKVKIPSETKPPIGEKTIKMLL